VTSKKVVLVAPIRKQLSWKGKKFGESGLRSSRVAASVQLTRGRATATGGRERALYRTNAREEL